MIKIYLDTCAIQRPLDTLNQTRLRLEAEVILGFFEKIKAGNIALISSTILELEIQRNPHAMRKEHAEQIIAQAQMNIILDEQIMKDAERFIQLGIKTMDALHLASAETARADFLCTCDDRFLRKTHSISDIKTVVASPIELIGVIE